MKNNLFIKWLVFGIVVLFVGAGVFSSIEGNLAKSIKIENKEISSISPLAQFSEGVFETNDKDMVIDVINEDYQTNSESVGSSKDVDWWPMFHHDPQLTGFSTSSAPNTNNVLWTYETGDYIELSSPAVDDGKLYIGTFGSLIGERCFRSILPGDEGDLFNRNHFFMDFINGNKNSLQFDGECYCLDTTTGNKIWNYSAEEIVTSSPAVYDDKVYFASIDEMEEKGNVSCLNAFNGDEIWRHPIFTYYTSPVVDDSGLYIPSIEVIEGREKEYVFVGKMLCLDAGDGSEIWNYTIGEWEYAMYSTPAVADNKVYVASIDEMEEKGNVSCLNAFNGDEIWRRPIITLFSSPVVYDGKLYVSSFNFSEGKGKILCLDAGDGSDIWNYTMGLWEYSMFSTPAVAYGNVYFSSVDEMGEVGWLRCLDALSGIPVWSNTTGEDIVLEPSPAVADEKLYIGTANIFGGADKVQCFDAMDGSFVWSYTLEDYMFPSPAIADGRLYIASDDGTIYAFGENGPPWKPTISGPSPGIRGKEYEYTFVATDRDGDDIFYYIYWGDATHTMWIGPYASGTEVKVKHTWDSTGNFTIMAKAKDVFDNEGQMGTLNVRMFRGILVWLFFQFLEWLFGFF